VAGIARQPVTMRVAHAGIATVIQYELRAPAVGDWLILGWW
jgi:hypothetical protein